MQADEIMTDQVVTVTTTNTLADALEVLAGLDVRHLPVVDDGELVGILSDRDIRSLGFHRVEDMKTVDRLHEVARTPVARVMSADVRAVEPGTDVREVIDRMLQEQVGALPVVEPHTRQLVGIISYIDVLRAASELFQD
ncbi:MAG: CBS domain-containing protein [Deltaproteobacteria bacterium]|nr:CBS domain-containing protein [Deltaproteobacteria bacterium]